MVVLTLQELLKVYRKPVDMILGVTQMSCNDTLTIKRDSLKNVKCPDMVLDELQNSL